MAAKATAVTPASTDRATRADTIVFMAFSSSQFSGTVRATNTPNDGTGPLRWTSHARVKERDEPCVHGINEREFLQTCASLVAAMGPAWLYILSSSRVAHAELACDLHNMSQGVWR